MNTIKSVMITAALASAVVIGAKGDKLKDKVQGKKQYIVVGKERGMVQSFSTNTDVIKSLDYDNGYVIKTTEEEANKLKTKGMEVYENRIYTYKMGGKCPKCEPCGEVSQPVPAPVPETFTDDIPWGTKRVQAVEALLKADPSDIKVCVLDTGIDTDHEDLKQNLVGGKSFISGNASFEDDEGHGTHVASTVAAAINDRGIIGVSQAKIYAIKVLGSDGSGYGSDIADGIRHARAVGCKVINMSLGSPAKYGPDTYIKNAVLEVANAGVKVVAAAGNDGLEVGYPAAIEHPNVTAVAALSTNGQLASFSSRGPQIDAIAPGVYIKGAKMGGGYVYWDGTSMATPHVAAMWALALSKGKTALVYDNLGLPPEKQGKGMPNAYLSVK